MVNAPQAFLRRTVQRLRHHLCFSTVLFLAFANASGAQVLKVKDFDLGSRDRRVLFDMATTPRGDALSFVANDTGNWELYRVSDWLAEIPNVEHLVLPGYFSKKDSRKDEKPVETMSTRVVVTRDGKYAICIGSAEWLKRVSGWAVGSATANDIISVVDLSTFKIVSMTQTENMNLFEFHGVDFDEEGYVRVSSLTSSGKVEHGKFISSGIPQRAAFIRLSVPSLEMGPRCTYDWIYDSPGIRHPQPITESRCDEAVGSKPLADYLREGEPNASPRPEVCENNDSKFCHVLPREFTADGKFGIGSDSEGHDNIFGSYVITSEALLVFSTSRRVEIGRIKAPTDDSFHEKTISLEGRDYLLVIQGGTHLMVYELRD
jgi:hypothetical protein